LFLLKVTHRKFSKLHGYPQKDVLVLMLPIQKRFASKVPAENRNCLSLPTKAGFFEKVTTDERKRLGIPIYQIKPHLNGSLIY